jgi:3-hydroxyisobutyrate dehydrogenase
VADGTEPRAALAPGAAVTFIGLGRMGLPMAGRLATAGYKVTGYDAAAAAREALTASAPSARVAATAAEATAGAEVVILMLPDSSVVSSVLEAGGVLAALPAGVVLIDMGSSEPAETQRLTRLAGDRGVDIVDAPVSGGVSGAAKGSLTIMAGGAQAAVEIVRPMLDVLGSRVLHVGPAGAGHAVKALNNLLSATHLLVTSEAMLVAGKFGLDVATVLDAINTSSGRSGSTENKWPNFILPQTYDSGFALRLMVKDMKIALSLIRETGGVAPLSAAALESWDAATAHLDAAADHTEIVRWLEQGAPEPLPPTDKEG